MYLRRNLYVPALRKCVTCASLAVSPSEPGKSTGQPGGQVRQPIRWSSPPANQVAKSTSQSGGQVRQPIRWPSPPANQVTKSVSQSCGQVHQPIRWSSPPANQEAKSVSQSGGQVHQPTRRPSPPANQETKSGHQPGGGIPSGPSSTGRHSQRLPGLSHRRRGRRRGRGPYWRSHRRCRRALKESA